MKLLCRIFWYVHSQTSLQSARLAGRDFSLDPVIKLSDKKLVVGAIPTELKDDRVRVDADVGQGVG